MTIELRAKDRRIIERCRALVEGFRARAARYDAEGRFPEENFEELKTAGLLSLMIPSRDGGLGGDLLSHTLASEQLARGDASTALNFSQHNIIMAGLASWELSGIAGASGRRLQAWRRAIFGRVNRERAVFASATTEPGVGFRPSRDKTRYRAVKGGFVLDGFKSFVSMAGHADAYVLPAVRAGQVSYFAVEADNPGLVVEPDWDTCGMRATVSHNIRLSRCAVPREALLSGVEGTALHHLLRRPHWAVGAFNGVYLGLCDGILEFACDYIGRRKSLARDSIVQHELGKLSVALEAARAVVYGAAELASREPDSKQAAAAVYRAKYLIGETAPRMASDAMRICGGNTVRKAFPLERYYRDARCGGLMTATSDVCLVYAGKSALGLDPRTLAESHW